VAITPVRKGGYWEWVNDLACRDFSCRFTRRLRSWLRQAGERAVWVADEPRVVRALAHGPLSDEDMQEYLRGCQTVLGLNQGRDRHGRVTSYFKLRDLEFPGHGCCYLIEHNADVAAALDVGRVVITHRSLDEAAALLARLAREPDRAAATGRAGRRRVLAEHTWAPRIRQLAAVL
jgi:spore maturation protein CgeB